MERLLLADEQNANDDLDPKFAVIQRGVHLVRDELDEAEASAASDLADEPLAVQRIGRYEIQRELGRGGMGIVYLARQDGTGQLVALKCLRSTLVLPQIVQRFEREAEVLGRLDHPGIAQLHDAGTALIEGQPQHFFARNTCRARRSSRMRVITTWGSSNDWI